MMLFQKYDERFCIKAALQVLQVERDKLCHDNVFHNPVIYSGLHEFESESLRSLYFQAYLVEWIDDHWNTMNDILERHQEYTIDEQKYMTIFFAQHLSNFIFECGNKGTLSQIAVPDLLKNKRKVLENMIKISDKWLENSHYLKAEKKKHKEQFARLIELYENESE